MRETVKTLGFKATDTEVQIIDRMRQRHYTLSQSEVIRMLIKAGATVLLDEKSKPRTSA